MGNPVKERKWYREWVVFRVPSLRVLDFQKIRDKVCHSSSIPNLKHLRLNSNSSMVGMLYQ